MCQMANLTVSGQTRLGIVRLGLPMFWVEGEEEEEILDSRIQNIKKEGFSVLILFALVFIVLFLS